MFSSGLPKTTRGKGTGPSAKSVAERAARKKSAGMPCMAQRQEARHSCSTMTYEEEQAWPSIVAARVRGHKAQEPWQSSRKGANATPRLEDPSAAATVVHVEAAQTAGGLVRLELR